MNTIPIIRLELERMQHAVHAMLTEHTAMLDEQVRLAVDAALTPENVGRVIKQRVDECIASAVSEEIRHAFSPFGAGRKAIREAVLRRLEEVYPEAP